MQDGYLMRMFYQQLLSLQKWKKLLKESSLYWTTCAKPHSQQLTSFERIQVEMQTATFPFEWVRKIV